MLWQYPRTSDAGEDFLRLGLSATITMILYSCAVLGLPVGATGLPGSEAKVELQETPRSAALSAYPESIEGLKGQLQDIFAAVKAGDDAKSAAYLADFSIPDHEDWFLKMFGPAEGARVAARYNELNVQTTGFLKKRIELSVKEGRMQIEVQALQ